MTLASGIILRAYRRANLVVKGQTPDTTEQSEALDFLNGILLSTIGNEAGGELGDLNVGGEYDDNITNWVPRDARLVLNLSGAQSLDLDPEPYEGQRLAIVDAATNLATYNLTLNGNGRKIEGATSLVLSTNGMDRQWLYRADTANWVKITSLAASDTMPLPPEFDGYFVDMLAMDLSPSHSAQVPQQVLMSLQRRKQQIQARYRKPQRRNEPIIGLLHQRRGMGESNTAFNRGLT
jgi:hypothetical protein